MLEFIGQLHELEEKDATLWTQYPCVFGTATHFNLLDHMVES
jgi:hypothetical protein